MMSDDRIPHLHYISVCPSFKWHVS